MSDLWWVLAGIVIWFAGFAILEILYPSNP